jgi:hypothetical protein
LRCGRIGRRLFVVVVIACAGVTPASLSFLEMTEIEDAHRRGVLRAVGTEYQFRHVRLQDYLAWYS